MGEKEEKKQLSTANLHGFYLTVIVLLFGLLLFTMYHLATAETTCNDRIQDHQDRIEEDGCVQQCRQNTFDIDALNINYPGGETP